MGYYEQRRKIAEELTTKLSIERPTFNKEQIDRLVAQLVAFYGMPHKAAKEMVDAQITIGNIKVIV